MKYKSKNGSKELVSLLQYMKNTTLDNSEILIKDKRIVELDSIVAEVRESEEWEESSMTILEIGMAKGEEIGMAKGEEIGMTKGEYKKLISLVCKKMEKGYTVENMTEILEEDESTIRTIAEIAWKYATEYDTAKILKELWENK